MKALENQLAGEQERCSQREHEVRQRWINWKASREGYSRAEEMTQLLLVEGDVKDFAKGKERRDRGVSVTLLKVRGLSLQLLGGWDICIMKLPVCCWDQSMPSGYITSPPRACACMGLTSCKAGIGQTILCLLQFGSHTFNVFFLPCLLCIQLPQGEPKPHLIADALSCISQVNVETESVSGPSSLQLFELCGLFEHHFAQILLQTLLLSLPPPNFNLIPQCFVENQHDNIHFF